MSLLVTIVGSPDRELLSALRDSGFRTAEASFADVPLIHPPGAKGPDAFVFDVRGHAGLPKDVATVRRNFPAAGAVVVASTLDPGGMLDAMRLGITEWLAEPLSPSDLDAALRRVTQSAAVSVNGKAFAIVGGKGGVGTTTVAVNLAAAIQRATKEPTLIVDLHMAQGDAAVLLGVEPRFSVLDALEHIQRLDTTYFKGLITPTKCRVDLLAAANRPAIGSVDVLRVRALLEFVTSVYPWVVIDCPRTDPNVLDVLDVATAVLVIANQELTTLKSASRLAGVLRQRCGNGRVKLAISRHDAESEIQAKDVERVLGGRIDYTFPSDYRAAVSALNRGQPLVGSATGHLTTSFEAAARELAGVVAAESREPAARSGLLARLGGRR